MNDSNTSNFAIKALVTTASAILVLGVSGCSVSVEKDCTQFEGKAASLFLKTPWDANGRPIPGPEASEWAQFIVSNGEGCATESRIQDALSYLQ